MKIAELTARIERVNKFIATNPTVNACVVTAIVTHKISNRRAWGHATKWAAKAAYDLGRDAGETEVKLGILQDFIGSHGLLTEFTTYVSSLRN